MNVLITGADRPLGRLLAEGLQPCFAVRGVACDQGTPGLPCVDLRTADAVAPHLTDVQAVIHAAVFDPATFSGPGAEQEALDRAARGTYVLMDEAARAGVDRVVLASSLSLMAAYPDDYVVDEMWTPRPDAAGDALAPHMAEIVCREYAREGGIRGVCLRFGDLDAPGGTAGEDAVWAVRAALAVPFSSPGYLWHVCHVSSSPRYPAHAARKLLGRDPGEGRR